MPSPARILTKDLARLATPIRTPGTFRDSEHIETVLFLILLSEDLVEELVFIQELIEAL